MNITIIGFGTLGDIQPLVALGKGLNAAGHSVRMASDELFEGLIKGAGLDFKPLRGLRFKGLIERVSGSEAIMGGSKSQWLQILSVLPLLKSGLPALGNSCYKAAQGSDCMLYAPILPGLWDSVAEKLNIPFVLTALQPFDITSEFPFPWVHPHSFGALLNRSSYYMAMLTLWPVLRSTINAWRKARLGLPSLEWNYLVRNAQKPIPRLYGFSPSVIPRPWDWKKHYTVTGYWFLDQDTDWSPPKNLSDFLESGPPPVCIGFGSMIAGSPEETTTIVLKALAKAKQRGILLSGWGGFSQADLPDNVLKLDWTPHRWLFPRSAAVVHHGGAGTTAAALRAGKPSIIVPFTADQPFWGKRIYDLGGGPKPIPRKKLNAKRLADAIGSIMIDKSIIDRAKELGEAIRRENGIKTAVKAFERLMIKEID